MIIAGNKELSIIQLETTTGYESAHRMEPSITFIILTWYTKSTIRLADTTLEFKNFRLDGKILRGKNTVLKLRIESQTQIAQNKPTNTE